ncbi:MAG: PEGA domain-containing protein [Candidatus Omnitrophica bacterium]|nr:PEGA domain-containing protein [Candidatus Omnitrophota bacterium]
MPLLRKIFFYIFCALYLIICPLLILRMLGFVTNPPTHQLVKTGIIYASSNPPGADVFINNIKAHETTPTIIRDLMPDNYTVRLEFKDYQTWQNTVPVVERKATVLEDILLIPQQWSVKNLSGLSFENMLPLGDGNTLLIWQEMTIKDLYLLRLNKESSNDANTQANPSQVTAVFPEEFIYRDAQILGFSTVDKSPFLILHILVADKHKYLWVDVRDKQIHIEDISDLLPLEPLKLWWEAGDEKIIYAFYNDHVNRLNIKAKAIYTDIAPKDIPPKKDIAPPQADIKGSLLDENNDLWLEFTAHKIGLWDKNQESMQWIFQNGHDIGQAFWANNGSAILLRDDNEIFLLNKETFGQTGLGDRRTQLQKITPVRRGTSMYYSEKTGKLYYIDPRERLLCAVQILRHKSILPKTIADTLRLKEFER